MNNLDQSGANLEKMNFLLLAFEEMKKRSKNQSKVFYTISLLRFNNKLPVLVKEPGSTNIKEQIEKYSSQETFNPDQLIIELFTARSHNVKKPFAVYKFDYKKANEKRP